MNCQEVLLQLEVSRPGSDDLQSPELRDAAAHLDGCQECQASFGNRQRLDERISRSMLDVPIPPGLKDRLLASLESGTAVASASEQGAGELPSLPQRRRWSFDNIRVRMAAAVTLATVVIAGLFFAFPPPESPQSFTLADVRESAELQLSELPPFDGNFTPVLPGGPWRSRQITIEQPPKGDLKDTSGLHRSASYRFTVRSDRGQEYRGVLLVIPRDVLDDPPSEDMFSAVSAQGKYLSKGNGKFHAVAWKNQSFVYVCFIRAGDEGLKTLKNALYPPPV